MRPAWDERTIMNKEGANKRWPAKGEVDGHRGDRRCPYGAQEKVFYYLFFNHDDDIVCRHESGNIMSI